MSLQFAGSKKRSIGVEIELQILDPHTFDLSPSSEKILAVCKERGLARVKSEIHQSMLEIDSEISSDVKECSQFLSLRLKELFEIAQGLGLSIATTGTHPFQKWEERLISTSKRYQALHEKYQWLARRMNVYGLHVHVGVASGDRALAISKALLPFLPHLLALSANSPFWQSIDTGMNSCRINIIDAFPFASPPQQFENWEEFETYYDLLIQCGVITSLKDLYWYIRPNPLFGTLEFRSCDAMMTLSETMAIVALIHCLVTFIDENLDQLSPIPKQEKWLFIENHWVAARYGLDGRIVAGRDGRRIKLSESIAILVEQMLPIAERLNCTEELKTILQILENGNGATRQRRIYSETGSFQKIVEYGIDQLSSDLYTTGVTQTSP